MQQGENRAPVLMVKPVGLVALSIWSTPVSYNASFWFNMALTWLIVIGAGALAMPHAMSQMGIVLGIFVILWSGATAGFGLYLQSRCAQYLERGTASFFALSQITYPNAAVIFDAAIAVKCFGVGVSYLIIIGDLMPGVVEGFAGDSDVYEFLLDRHFWVTAFMYAIRSATTILELTFPG